MISVTPTGKALLDHHRDPERDVGQVYYAGWVKPAEIWHDASLFRMVREVEQELAREGQSHPSCGVGRRAESHGVPRHT